PVIETPLSAAASIQELFLQDWGGALRVFPAVPGQWSEAAFDRLRADGAFLVSAVRRNGRTSWVRIESLAGEPCRLVVADWDTAVVRAHTGPAPRVKRDSAGASPGSCRRRGTPSESPARTAPSSSSYATLSAPA